MNNIFTITSIEENGVIHFDFNGENIQETYEVSIVDDNTGLTVHKSNLGLRKDSNWWISTGEVNAKRLRNITFSINYDNLTYSQELKLFGQNRFLVINSKQVKLSHLGDDLFPIVTEIFYDKVYERDFVRLNLNDVVVDIGANYGVFSLYSQMFNPSKVYAVEPLKATFKSMKKNLTEYGVTCINKAVSSENGFEKFMITEVNGNNFSEKNGNGFHPSSVIGEEIVETVTINQLVSDYDIDRIDFLKVDCEGGELDLFRTIDKEYLQNNIGKIAMEYHSKEIHDEVIDILKSNNFIIEDTLGSNDIGLIYAYNINLIQ
jgi:FkbM family methyltransferase